MNGSASFNELISGPVSLSGSRRSFARAQRTGIVSAIIVDGSFVTDMDVPNDVDAPGVSQGK